MNYLRLSLSIVFMTVSVLSNSQVSPFDSLKSSLEYLEDDTARVNTLNKLADLLARTEPDEAIVYSSDATILAGQLDYQQGLAAAYNNLGLAYYMQGKYFEAFNNWGISLQIYEDLGKDRPIADLVSSLGSLYYTIGNHNRAIEYYLKAAKISERLNDSIRIATLFLNIGSVYSEQPTKLDSAMNYYQRAFRAGELIAYQELMGEASIYLGELFFNEGLYDSALVYFNKSLSLVSYSLDKSNTLNFLGKIYAEKGDYETSINYHREALEMARSDDAQLEKVQVLLGLASTFMKQSNPQQAIDYYEEAKSLAKEIGLKHELSEAYEGLSISYSEIKDFKRAYEYLSLQNDIANTIFSVKIEQEASNQMISYQRLEKEKEDEINVLVRKSEIEHLNSRRQRALNIAFGTLGLLFLLLSMGFYSRFRYIRRTNKMIKAQNDEIESQRDEIEAQRDQLISQKNNITDSINYAQRLQSAVLPSPSYMDGLMAEYFILFKPRDIVSGDFYWIKEINNQLIVVGVDCTGHGVPGGFMSMLGVTLLNDLLGHGNFGQPAEILGQLRMRVKEMFVQEGVVHDQKDGMDMAMAIIDQHNKELKFAGANNPLYLIREKNQSNENDLKSYSCLENGKYLLYEMKGDKQPIGIHWEESDFTNHTFKLQEQDTIYLFSDGIIDQYGGANRKKYKSGNFKNLLLSIQEQTMVKQKQLIEDDFETWKGNYEQIDDVCVIGVRF